MPVQMELSRILIRELNDYQLIELREVLEDEQAEAVEPRWFPIVIGLPESQAIERRLKHLPVQRPQTHDLLANLVTELGATLESICINDLNEHTFFATLDIRTANDEPLHVDARPSDAIALAIGMNVPIFVAEHVLDATLNEEI